MIRLDLFAARIAGVSGAARILLAALSGAAAALSMPPVFFFPALFMAFPILAWLIDGARGQPGAGFLTGWAFGLGYFIVVFHWIAFAFFVDADAYLWMMPFAVGGLAAAMAVYWGIACAIAARLWPEGPARLFYLAALLAIAELARGHLLTGFPWSAPGLAVMASAELSQAAAYAGMPGLTFMVIAVSFFVAYLATRSGRIVALCLMGAVALAWLGGTWRLREPVAFLPDIRLRIIQPNISQDMKWRGDNSATIFNTLTAMSAAPSADAPRGIADITHVFWPESSVPFFIEESEAALSRLADLLPARTSLTLGALRRDAGDKTWNSILTYDGEGNLASRYDKWRLVPGGEFLPLAWLLKPLGFDRLVQTPGDFEAGPGPVTLPMPGAPAAGLLVCYEAVFPDRLVDRANRPAWLINVTNDGWFGMSAGPWQHFAQARMRAIEQGLPLVRAANTGISAVVGPRGEIIASLPLGSNGTLDAALPVALAPGVYARHGDRAAALLIGLGLMAGFTQLSRASTRRAKSGQ